MSAALTPLLTLEGHVLVIGTVPDGVVSDVSRDEITAPDSLGALRSALATRARSDAALIYDWARDVSLAGLVEEVRTATRDGGRVMFVVPIVRRGWRGARGALLGALRRRPPVLLEALSGALLLGGCVDVRARELEGAPGLHVVWARVPTGTGDDAESSAIRSTGLTS